jgi:hypothetical protein
MRKIFLMSVSLAFMALAPAGARAMDGREACEADAERLCSQHIPDALAVEQCLKAHANSLSGPCRAEFGGGKPAKRGHRRH